MPRATVTRVPDANAHRSFLGAGRVTSTLTTRSATTPDPHNLRNERLKAMTRPASLAFLAALCLLPPGLCRAAVQTGGKHGVVFQIGTFDRSSEAFARGSAQHPVTFIVGKSTVRADWYAAQPAVLAVPATKTAAQAAGVLPATAASAKGATPESVDAAPRKITFTLHNPPSGSYRLHIALLLEDPSVPGLRVAINQKHGTFYLHPRLDLNSGDGNDSFNPIYSHADVVFRFPASYLHQGKNVISLQAVEHAAKMVTNAGINYDAVSLDNASARARKPEASALIIPTIFYQQNGRQLDELVDVFIRSDERAPPGSHVTLTLAGQQYRQPVAGAQDFGDQKFQFQIPQFSPHTEASLAWGSAGHPRQLRKTLQPSKKWTLFLVPSIHLDLGYTDYPAKVAAIQSRVLGEAMDFTAHHPDFVFSPDGEWALQQFLKTRTAAQQQRIITAVEKKQIFIPAQYANVLTGVASAETVIRSLYPSANFSRLHGTPFNYANLTDVPSASWSYPSILASAGIHYFLEASNNFRAPILLQGRLQYQSPMWWVGPDGKKVLFWSSRHYMQMQFLFGLPPVLAAGRDTLPLFMQMYDSPTYRAHAAIMFGSQAENTDLFPGQATLAKKWNAIYAYPHIQYTGIHHAMKTIADQFGGHLRTMRGDGGPYWEDGIASDAYYAAMERDNEGRGPSAEKLETVNSLITPGIAADRADLSRMWTHIVLTDEHTFSSYNSVSQPRAQLSMRLLKLKNRHAADARFLAARLARRSMESIVNSISAPSDSLVVFNMLNWQRSGLVSLDLPDGVGLMDATNGQSVPVETLFHGRGFRRVRFLATDVPAVGYKVYLRHKIADRQPTAKAATSTGTTLQSPFYRVVLDPVTGAIKSIYDKQLHRELVNTTSPYRFGQYLYVTGGDHGPNSLLSYRPISPRPTVTIHPAHEGSLFSVTRTPFGWVAKMKSSDTHTPEISTEIVLFNGQKKIELIENVDKNYVLSKEGVYFAFPFAMDHPQFHYEIQNGVVDPATDMIPGAGHVWFSVQHWVSVAQHGFSGTVMPLDASLVTLGDINRGAWPTQFGTRRGTIFSYVMNNYWNTNYAAGQGGHFRFRYVITSASATDPAALSRLGWEEVTPLELDQVTTQDKALDTPRALSERQGSFLTVGDPDVVLDTWKPAEDGDGTILRFVSLGAAKQTLSVKTPLLDLSHVWLTDAVERNQKPLPLTGAHGFSTTIGAHDIVTVRIMGKPTTHQREAD